METYQAFYQNEIRALQITINDQDGNPFETTAASASILDSTGTTVIPFQTASVTSNTVSTIVGRTVTKTVGKYKIIWRLFKNDYIYFHVSELEIMEL